MKVTVELSTPEEIRRFYERMFCEDKPKVNVTMFAEPKPEEPAPQPFPDGFKPAPESVPFPGASDSVESAPQPMMNAPETKTPAPSFDDVTQAAIKRVQAGKQAELRTLLQKYGVQALPELKDKPEQLAAFYKDLEVL